MIYRSRLNLLMAWAQDFRCFGDCETEKVNIQQKGNDENPFLKDPKGSKFNIVNYAPHFDLNDCFESISAVVFV